MKFAAVVHRLCRVTTTCGPRYSAPGKSSRGAIRPGRCRTRRLTLRRPLPNHRTLDGFPGSWRCGGIIGNVTGGPKSGILIAADPATVERSGFAIELKDGRLWIAWCDRRRFGTQPEKPLAWLRDQPGWTPLLLRIVRLSRNRPQRRASETRKGSLWHRKAPGR
jgi:hypothetical protein